MADVIQSIFIDPPIAIARLGGSTVPQDAYLWVESPDPRSDGETTIVPTWSLDILRLTTVNQTAHAIGSMQVRGAPLIGAAMPASWAANVAVKGVAGPGLTSPLPAVVVAPAVPWEDVYDNSAS